MLFQGTGGQGLFDHHQSKLIEFFEDGPVFGPVRGIRVHHQRNFPEALANFLDQIDVPAGFDLDLDAPIALP